MRTDWHEAVRYGLAFAAIIMFVTFLAYAG